MRITAAEAAGLDRKREQPTREPGDLIAIFVPGKLLNPLNQSAWIWQKRKRYASGWKDRVATAIFVDQYKGQGIVGVNMGWILFALEMREHGPKRISFLASTHNAMDSDGLQAALKPIRDSLIACGVITGDADKDGNVFEYRQKIDRKRRGVEIRVQRLTTRGRGDIPPS